MALGTRQRLRASSCLLALVLLMLPHSAKAWWNGDWSYRRKITIDASPKGAALTENVGQIPLLIRLHDGNFHFSDAKNDGSDLRFIAGDDKTPLKFHIESYDSLLGIALVWVGVPEMHAGATIDLWLYYGNAKAPSGADPKGSYDADTKLVYHFAERNAPPKDSTANANDALSPATTDEGALIGSGARFTGANAVTLPGSSSLALAQGASFTWSAWVKSDGPQSNAVLFARHDGGRALVIGLDQDAPFVSVSDGSTTVRSTAAPAPAPHAWHHLAVTASDQIRIYVDGKPYASAAAAVPALSGPASLGADTDAAGAVTGTGFAGELDELEIAGVARSAGYIAAIVASEGEDEKLLAFGAEEENGTWSTGYFGVILKSVTVDGWVVIALLGIMAAVSWVVMIVKALSINELTRANGRFLEAFGRFGADFERFANDPETDGKRLRASPLFHIYIAGHDELRRRISGDGGGAASQALSPRAITSIRASLDAVATREGQRLNSMMVLLTIAISGGPFLGLLGTVVGVMITFAAIAATGDVNVNAIAPGIAAALVATVAGLAVAIPALFGYNYLITKIRDSTADMHVFVDEFAARLAETFSGDASPRDLAAE